MDMVPCKGNRLEFLPVVFSLTRSPVVQLSSMGHLSNPLPQDRGLGRDISILGGNRTGVYVQWVKPGSEAERTGLTEGCHLLKVSLEIVMMYGTTVHLKQETFMKQASYSYRPLHCLSPSFVSLVHREPLPADEAHRKEWLNNITLVSI